MSEIGYNDLSGYDEIVIGGKNLPFKLGKIGGIPIPFKFGSNAYRLFCQHRNIEFYQMGPLFEIDPFAMMELSYFAHVTAMRMKDEPTFLGLDSFVELVGDNKDIMKKLDDLLGKANVLGIPISDMVKEAKKKQGQ